MMEEIHYDGRDCHEMTGVFQFVKRASSSNMSNW